MARPGFQFQSVPMTVNDSPTQVAYLRQVLNYLLLGLLVACGGGFFGMQPPVLGIVAAHPFIGLFAMLGLVMWATRASTGPNAGPVYYVFTFAMGLIMAPALAGTLMKSNGGQTLALAGVLTVVNTLALTGYAWSSKRDFSFMGGFLITGLITMMVATLLNGLWLHSPFMALAIPGVMVLLFNGFILYDLSRIIHYGQQIPPTAAALGLFLDIFNLFLSYLRILDRD